MGLPETDRSNENVPLVGAPLSQFFEHVAPPS